MLDPALLDILVCPADRGPLLYVPEFRPDFRGDGVLYNPRLRRAYRIEDGIPVLLVDEAEDVGPEDHQRWTGQSGGGDSLDSGTTA